MVATDKNYLDSAIKKIKPKFTMAASKTQSLISKKSKVAPSFTIRLYDFFPTLFSTEFDIYIYLPIHQLKKNT